MSGVNLIDFTMPVAVPAGGKKENEVKHVGGFKITIPKKKEAETEPAKSEEKVSKMDWWDRLKPLLPLIGILVVMWYVWRRGK